MRQMREVGTHRRRRSNPAAADAAGGRRLSARFWAATLAAVVGCWCIGAAAGLGYTLTNQPAASPEAVTHPDGGDAGLQSAASPPRFAAAQPSSRPTGTDLFFRILGRNLSVYAWLLCGVACLGISTVVVLLFNGIHFGQIVGLALAAGATARSVAWLTVPHGVLELAAFFLAGCVGILGPRLAMAWFRHRGGLGGELRRLVQLWPLTLAGAAAVALAAAIEAFVTLPLAQGAEA